MSEQPAPARLRPDSILPPEGGQSRWVGWLLFAAAMMIVLGAFNIIDAVVALVDDQEYAVSESSLLVFDYPTWGWLWLLFGVVTLVAGFGVLAGQKWARAVGVGIAALNAVAQLAFIAAAPFWSTLIIALDVVVIYALTAHGAELGPDFSHT